MPKETTYAGMMGQWQHLLATLEEKADEIPNLAGTREQLKALLEKAQDASKRQTVVVAEKQEISQQLRGFINEGQRLTHILHLSLKAHYGIRSEKLATFRLRPFRGRKVKEGEPEAPAKTPPSSTPA